MPLSKKIMMSYIVLLVCAFIVTNIITSTVVSRDLRRQSKGDLAIQSEAVVEAIKAAKFNLDEPRKIRTFLNNSKVANLIPSEIFLFNDRKTLIYGSDESMTDADLLTIITGENQHYLGSYKILMNGDELVGYMLLTIETQRITNYVRTFQRSFLLGMMVALLIGVVLAAFMRRNIVKPIVSLKEDMDGNLNDPSKVIRPIQTGDEIQELYETYIAMDRSIKNHMDERKRFFQNASHELKTPLMSIQGYAEAIRDGVVEGVEVEESLNIIIGKSQQLKKTVEEIIYLSKLVNNDFDYTDKDIHIVELIQAVIEEQALIADERHITLNLEAEEEDLRLKLDPIKFESVIENLISNGLRYAKTMVKIQVQKEEDTVLIRVMDDGSGLKKGEEGKVFERFYKGEGGNSGIGLAIVSEIVGHYGGSIQAGNQIGGGAVFEICLKRGNAID